MKRKRSDEFLRILEAIHQPTLTGGLPDGGIDQACRMDPLFPSMPCS